MKAMQRKLNDALGMLQEANMETVRKREKHKLFTKYLEAMNHSEVSFICFL